jgi:TetR/AcrR family transcriptional regulator, transcriptional repressor for nem operon
MAAFVALYTLKAGGRSHGSCRRSRDYDEGATLAATSLDDLMRVTGLGKGSIYGAFGDKRNLFLAVLRVYADERVARLPG